MQEKKTMQNEKNSESLNTNPKNNVDLKANSFICQKLIVDKANNSISEFIVISDSDLIMQDWVIKPKFSEIVDGYGATPLEYPLKRTIQGNVDEGRKHQEGKALRVTLDKDVVSMGVYTQSYGQAWELSHTHTIDKVLFDAYALVVSNDQEVAKAEKDKKLPVNFSLNLS